MILNLKKVFDSLNFLDFKVTHPFLLSVYDDYEEDTTLTKEDFIKIVQYVESYVLRRYICEIPTNSMNKTFASLHKHINKNQYLNSFLAELMQYNKNQRFPKDEEFIESLKHRNIYKNNLIRQHMLNKLENYNTKEYINIENCTIEHIMPQHLTKEWQDELGENFLKVHEEYLHTIGNLTLTLYNSEMKNKSFHDKKYVSGGFIDSKLRLNKSITKLDKWNEKAIINRTKELTEDIVNIWNYPVKTDEIMDLIDIKKEDKYNIEYNLEDFKYLKEKTYTRFLFDLISPMILKLDNTVKQNIGSVYIGYKTKSNFVEIIPQKQGLKLFLDINIENINDSRKYCEDVQNKGHSGTGTTIVYLKKEEDVLYVFDLIKQVYLFVEK